MSIFTTIKQLANKKDISIYKIEHDLNLANGSISKWNKSDPTATTLQKVASYLGVTTDFILNQSKITK
ncbi:MAG TPA: helix-turn-helix domain-containing protein [Candidatus Ligilactobacillus excrementigallinarum]|uniref:Helix-turn-helix domain-containing protein n=1 Tax=Candidatus Ligilactobacillus excrementigallinarum TaxID=2838641 RepID=A0A9D2AA02_9LACO|nr:helix-turn-helix domain-containing protein [Candidatus Ligilactobacillus excrementigallinarum]